MAQGRRFAHLLLWVIMLGCLGRVLWFVLDLEVYHDDAYLLNNVLTKSYGELIGPLDNNQAAPPAFLWISKWVLGLTHADWGGRLVPFLAGMGGLGIFYWAAREMLNVLEARLATAWMAASRSPWIYTVRAKPYAIDFLVGAIVLLLLLRWMRRPREVKYLLAMAIMTPVVFWISYTSTFVMASAAIVTFLYAFTHRRLISRGFWPAWIALAISGVVGGGVIHHYHLASCMTAEHTEYLHHFWAGGFPPLKNPLRFLEWLINTHTGKMYAYPFGENHFLSLMPFLLWLAGVAAFLRKGRNWILAALLVPQALLFGAAVLDFYPYGSHPRLCLFLAPAMCALMAVGALQTAKWFRPPGRAIFLSVVTVALLLASLAHIGAAVWLRIDEHRSGSIKHDLIALIDSHRPGDLFRQMSMTSSLEGGGSFPQIAEYYLRLLPWPTPLNGPIPVDAPPGRHLILLRLLAPDQSVADSSPDPMTSQAPEIQAAWRPISRQDLGPKATQGQLVAFTYEPMKPKSAPAAVTLPD